MTWWRRLCFRSRMENQLEKELQFHLDQHAAGLIEEGYRPEEAQRLARMALGGPEQVKEACRDARGTRWLEDFWLDLRYAIRGLRQRPGFSVVALLTLALGTGATTVMFTVINGVLLKPLPYPDPDRLLQIDEQTKGMVDYRWGDRWAFAYPNYLDCRREVRSIVMGARRYSGGTISGPVEPEYVDGNEISSNMFTVLGVGMFRGRAFLPEEDRPGAEPVIVISYGLWQRRFGGSEAVLGSPITFEGKRYTIVGIAPPSFRLGDVDVFIPIGQNNAPVMQNREAHPGIVVWARLKPGSKLVRAQAELEVVARRLQAQYPKSNAGRGFIAEPLRPDVGDVGSSLWILLGAVSLVLLIACVNVASLLLARAVSRDRELAMRSALGASRGRLVRQCLTESAVLSIGGGLLGVALATLGIRPFIVFWPGGLPRANEIQLDARVLLFALAVSLGCGILFGLAPALRAPATSLEQALRAGARTIAGGSRRVQGAFVISEIALAMILLVCAALLGGTLLHLSGVNPGVNVHNVLTARMALSPAVLENPAQIRAAWQDVLERTHRVPGVESVATVDTVPMREGDNELGYWKTPNEPPRNQKPLALANSVSPDYLKVMGIPLRRGRFLTAYDRVGSEPVIVIDEVMAQHAFPEENPIGKHLWTDLVPEPLTIVGVVGHVRQWGLAGDDTAQVRDQFYYPFAQVPDGYLRRWSELMSIAVRTGIEPLSALEPLRHALRGTGGDQVLYEVHTLEQLASASIGRQRFLLMLFSVFGAVALLLACIGIYGVLAYLTTQRVPEIGVRMALGATARDVLRLVLRQSFVMIVLGVVAGMAVAWEAARVMSRQVVGIQTASAATFLVTAVVLLTASLSASFVPARRASRVDPLMALRQE